MPLVRNLLISVVLFSSANSAYASCVTVLLDLNKSYWISHGRLSEDTVAYTIEQASKIDFEKFVGQEIDLCWAETYDKFTIRQNVFRINPKDEVASAIETLRNPHNKQMAWMLPKEPGIWIVHFPDGSTKFSQVVVGDFHGIQNRLSRHLIFEAVIEGKSSHLQRRKNG